MGYIWNLFCHNSPMYQDNGYNEEEWKMVGETPKIFEGPFRVGVTCVRVPVLRAHCESINLQFSRRVTLAEVYEVLNKAPGIRVVDDRVNNQHPEPQKSRASTRFSSVVCVTTSQPTARTAD